MKSKTPFIVNPIVAVPSGKGQIGFLILEIIKSIVNLLLVVEVTIHITKKYPHLDIWVNDLYEHIILKCSSKMMVITYINDCRNSNQDILIKHLLKDYS